MTQAGRPPKGMFVWGDPDDDSGIEPKIQAVCARVNSSGWCWTSESCQGHDRDDPEDVAIGGWRFPCPFLRFVLRDEHVGRLLRILAEAHRGYNGPMLISTPTCTFEAGWIDVPVYIGLPDGDWGRATLPERRAVFAGIAEALHRQDAPG